MEYKKCSICRASQPATTEFFYLRRTNDITGRLYSECKDCVSIRGRSRYLKNKEKILKQNKEYRERNKDFIKQRRKERWQVNLAQNRKNGRLRYWKNRDKILVERRKSRGIFSYYKSAAKRREYQFNLNFEQFIQIGTGPCFYCGDLLQRPAIDRIDNSQGYIIGNCVPCYKRCNEMKWADTVPDWLRHIDKILKHQKELTF